MTLKRTFVTSNVYLHVDVKSAHVLTLQILRTIPLVKVKAESSKAALPISEELRVERFQLALLFHAEVAFAHLRQIISYMSRDMQFWRSLEWPSWECAGTL